MDSKRDTLWATDFANNYRVVAYKDVSQDGPVGGQFDVVLGGSATGCSNNEFFNPQDVHVDSNGNLWVADYWNNRIMRFNDVDSLQSGAFASIILGNNNCSSGTSQSTFFNPFALEFDEYGTLYVADRDNNRVLGFLNAVQATQSGFKADFVVGQQNFNIGYYYGPVDQFHFSLPGIAFDTVYSHSLIVADFNERRILRYCRNVQ
jgi:hypothetical protein